MRPELNALRRLFIVALSLAAAACGGGRSDGTLSPAPAPAPAPSPAPPSPPPPPPSQGTLSFNSASWTDAVPMHAGVRRSLQATALTYDATHDQLVAAVVTDDGSTSLLGLDPSTLVTRWSLAAPDVIGRLVVSDDGSALYSTLPGSSAVWQVDLTRNVETRRFSVGDASLEEEPVDVAIRPGNPDTVAVSIARLDLPTTPFQRITVYDRGVARPSSTGENEGYGLFDGASEIVFVDADHVVGYDIDSTACSLHRLDLLPDGLKDTLGVDHLGRCFDDQLNVVNGRLITRGGTEYDPVTLALVRAWPGVNGAYGGGLLDPALDSFLRINAGSFAAVGSDSRQRVAVEEYENSRHSLRRSFVTEEPSLMGAGSFVVDLTTSGAGRVAFTVYDRASGAITLHSYDLATVPVAADATFSVASAADIGVSGVQVDMSVVEIGYDPVLQRLVAALPASIGANGNSLAIVNPDTGAVERIILLPDEPAQLQVSSTGSLAYVALRGSQSLVQVDLVAGRILGQANVRADSLVIKEGDPTMVAAMRHDILDHTTIVTLRNMTPFGAVVDASANPAISLIDWIGSNGGELLGFASSTTDATLAHFVWDDSGLTLNGAAPFQLGIGGARPAVAFGQMWNSMNVYDLTTLQWRGAFPIGTSWSLLSSRIAGVAAQAGSSETIKASWVQAPADSAPSAGWQPVYSLTIVDPGLTELGLAQSPWKMVSMVGDRIAMPVHWSGSVNRESEPGRLYLLNRH